jgi:hypothetical protein
LHHTPEGSEALQRFVGGVDPADRLDVRAPLVDHLHRDRIRCAIAEKWFDALVPRFPPSRIEKGSLLFAQDR